MSPKIAFMVATVLAVAGIAASVTVPEVRCFLRLDSAQCASPQAVQTDMKDVELTVQTQSQQPLAGVSVEFKSKGAPENALTDSNGYVKIRIPETDVQVTLQKNGFEPLSYIIDLHKDPSITRTYRLKSTVESLPLPTPALAPSPVPAPSAPERSSSGSTAVKTSNPPTSGKLEAACRVFGDSSRPYKELISVANKTEEPESRFLLTSSNPRSLVCKIEKNSGELDLAYALPDNSALKRIEVKVYVDGNIRQVFNLGRGELLRKKIDLRGASGYKVDFSITSPRDTYYHSDSVYIIGK